MHAIPALNGFSDPKSEHMKIGGKIRGGTREKKVRGGFDYNTYLNI